MGLYNPAMGILFDLYFTQKKMEMTDELLPQIQASLYTLINPLEDDILLTQVRKTMGGCKASIFTRNEYILAKVNKKGEAVRKDALNYSDINIRLTDCIGSGLAYEIEYPCDDTFEKFNLELNWDEGKPLSLDRIIPFIDTVKKIVSKSRTPETQVPDSSLIASGDLENRSLNSFTFKPTALKATMKTLEKYRDKLNVSAGMTADEEILFCHYFHILGFRDLTLFLKDRIILLTDVNKDFSYAKKKDVIPYHEITDLVQAENALTDLEVDFSDMEISIKKDFQEICRMSVNYRLYLLDRTEPQEKHFQLQKELFQHLLQKAPIDPDALLEGGMDKIRSEWSEKIFLKTFRGNFKRILIPWGLFPYMKNTPKEAQLAAAGKWMDEVRFTALRKIDRTLADVGTKVAVFKDIQQQFQNIVGGVNLDPVLLAIIHLNLMENLRRYLRKYMQERNLNSSLIEPWNFDSLNKLEEELRRNLRDMKLAYAHGRITDRNGSALRMRRKSEEACVAFITEWRKKNPPV